MKLQNFFCVILALFSFSAYAQNGVVSGKVFEALSNEPIPFANVVISGTTKGATTDEEGIYRIENIEAGLISLEVSVVGFKKNVIFEIQVSNARVVTVDFPMIEDSQTLEAVEITASPFQISEASPVSLRRINSAEIMRNPGGNRDISKVLQSLPGVASSASFRNDIIIRGGAPNENRFYLDGIEVPNINHFATQGSSGGPVGMINVNFVREVDFYSGAFPSNRGNSLSSVLEFTQKEGNEERLIKTFMVGSSDFGLTLDGPLGKKSNVIFSVRRSYLQLLFKALGLPFLPTYTDAQYKQVIRFNKKNQLTLIGLGALDDFVLNTSVNDNITDIETIERNTYLLGNIPVNNQWNYTLGARYNYFGEKSLHTFVVSRNHLNNEAVKYENNEDTDPSKLILNYISQEIENKLRYENDRKVGEWDINYGVSYEYAQYSNETFNRISIGDSVVAISFNSELNMHKMGAFSQFSRRLLKNRMGISLGLRTDFNAYSSEMSNPLQQLSPRISVSYDLNSRLSLNFNTGRYYQLPAYTVLGYRNEAGDLQNKLNGIKYITADHLVGGIKYLLSDFTQITVESFYKKYANYPFLTNEQVSLANLGGDFGVIGNEPAKPLSTGRSYGIEFLAQKKMQKNFYGILAYTFVKSEFTDDKGVFRPSAWDNGHIVSLTGGKKFKRNWELGVKFRFLGAAPYTPYDVQRSSLKAIWDVTGRGLPDYSQLNTQRNTPTHGLDVRIDKKYYFNKWSMNFYLDIQNIYNNQTTLAPYLNVKTDVNGTPLTDPSDPSRYQVYSISNTSGTVLPSIGLMIEF